MSSPFYIGADPPWILRPKATRDPLSVLRIPAEGPLLVIQHLHPEALIRLLAWGLHENCRAW
jgi:hypothetical protein